jgi:MFS family permease
MRTGHLLPFVLGFAVNFTVAENENRNDVRVLMNKVWSIDNPVETYRFYDFPFCRPDGELEDVLLSFGQVLRGDRLSKSLYLMNLGEAVISKEVCRKSFSQGEIDTLSSGIENRYVFEMYVGDLPVVIPFGSGPKGNVNLCTHVKFEVSYQKLPSTRIVGIEAVCDGETKLQVNQSVAFSYTVSWKERSDIDPDDSWWLQQIQLSNVMSMLRTGQRNRNPLESKAIHWMSILNSFILAFMIVSLVLIVLVRTVRADLSKYIPSQDPETAEESEDPDSIAAWKLLHGDVFRPPPHRMWLCAALGAGTQLLFVACTILIVGAVGNIYSQRGTLVSAAVVLYMLSAAIAGFVSARMYHRIGGVKWKWNMIVTALFFTGPAFIVWSILNSVAIVYSSTAAFPFLTILQLFAMWGLVTIPLTVIGGTLGRQQAMKVVRETPFPVKTNRIPREVPKLDSVMYSRIVQLTVVGFISFLSIYLELKFIFKSVWTDGLAYTLFGILIASLVLLFLLSTVLTVLFTYFQLNAEDYRWWWRSLISGGSVGLFVYFYSIYFFVTSGMSGTMQSTFFFLYSALIAYAIALCVGALSFAASYRFVWTIYKNLKAD